MQDWLALGGSPLSIHSETQLQNTKEKLRLLEEHYERRQAVPAEDAYVRELSLRSVKRFINQLKEEIIRYEAHAKAKR